MDRQKEDSYQIVNYYKRNRTIDMLLMEEFAFSLLFNNIAPDKLQVALDSVGLNRIPSLFLLIQVDDHLNESKRLNTENEFVLKVRIANRSPSSARRRNRPASSTIGILARLSD